MTSAGDVLVTAVGGDMGQALVKALRLSHRGWSVVGVDGGDGGSGTAFVDGFRTVPYARDTERYVAELDRAAAEWGVAAVVPAAEAEIAVLAALEDSRLPSGIPVVCQSLRVIGTAGDKLACMDELRGAVDLAPYADGSDDRAVARLASQAGFPLVVKSRIGSGSKSLRVVEDPVALAAALAAVDRPIVQGYIGEAGGEFSVGVFGHDRGFASIVLRRTLGPVGCSWYAEVVEDEEVAEYSAQVARALGVSGSVNVQVRRDNVGIRLLEVNPRFSSLVAARALAGFRDLEWSIELAMGSAPDVPKPPWVPIRFQRFFHEVVKTPDAYVAVAEWAPRTLRADDLLDGISDGGE